jgi:putative transposase
MLTFGMARQLRIELSGGIYHVLARGNEKKRIFRISGDRDRFLSLLPKAHAKYNCLFYAYGLLPNHYHLLIKTEKQNLSEVMHFINVSYSVYFNKKHNRTGHLFQGRFKSIIVEEESYLLELSRYIHTNADRAGFKGKINDRTWTSFCYYAGSCEKIPWLRSEWIIERFGKSWSIAQKEYARFIEDGLGGRLRDPLENAYKGVILGSQIFIDKTKQFSKKKLDHDIASYKSLSKWHTFDNIIGITSTYFKISAKELYRRRRLFLPRQITMYLVKEYTDLTLNEIGHRFGISGFAVSKNAKKIGKGSKDMKVIRELKKLLESN